MHTSPALVVWALRWFPSEQVQQLRAADPAAAAAFTHGGFSDIVLNGMALYMIWAVAYYLKVRYCLLLGYRTSATVLINRLISQLLLRLLR